MNPRTTSMVIILALAATLALLLPAGAWGDDGGRRRPPGEVPRGLGMDPAEIVSGDMVVPTAMGVVPTAGADQQFRLHFHGFFRVPLRIGFGVLEDPPSGVEEGVKLHVPARIPDCNYLDPRFTNNLGGPWTELHLAYGNATVAANVSIAAWTFTDAGYNNLGAQLGINHAFLTLSFPELFGDRGGIVAHVGSLSNRYGAAGRYSAGKYETYLFGASHVAGENVRAFVDLGPVVTLHVEQGLGAKLEVPPLTTGALAEAPYLPYGGDVQQGSTLLGHFHAGVAFDDTVTVGGHVMSTFTADAENAGEKDGSITVAGADVRIDGARFGDGYLGYSHVQSHDVERLAGALELLHSMSGWNYADNYFGSDASGTGSIDSVLFQYTLSVGRIMWHPEAFWGQHRDLLITPFVMYNHITGDEASFDAPTDRLKLGGEVTYTPLPWLGLSFRYDGVMPDLDDNDLWFHVLSPKVILRSAFASHEQVVVQYSGYIDGGDVTPAWPYEASEPDKHVVTISAVMWW